MERRIRIKGVKMSQAIEIWKESVAVIRKNPLLAVPFIVSVLIQIGALYLLYVAPCRPVSYVLAPPIRAFFGERFLHYPFNLIVLPRLFYYANIVVGMTIGILLTATAVGMLADYYYGRKAGFFANLKAAAVRYFRLLGIWLIVFVFSFMLERLVGGLARGAIKRVFPYLFFIAVSFIQFIFIYAIPAVVIEKKDFIASLKRGLSFLKHFFTATFILVMMPLAFYLPVVFLKQHLSGMVERMFPEMILIVMIGGLIVLFVIDLLITVSCTFLFLKKGAKQP